MENTKWTVVGNVDNVIEAAIIQDILETEGIQSKAIYKNNTEYMKLLTGNIFGTEGIDILVLEEDMPQAQEIIKEYRESQFEEFDE